MRARSTTLLVLFLACSLITLAVLLSFSGASPVAAQSGVRHVAPGAECGSATPCYASVQAALDAASPGDLIKVAGGTYAGVTSRQGYSQSVYISQTITIRGGHSTADWSVSDPVDNVTTLDAENLGYVVRTAGWSGLPNTYITVTLEALDLAHGAVWGVMNDYYSRLHVRDCQVRDTTGTGIYVVASGSVVSASRILRNGSAAGSGGIYIGGALNVRVEGNTVGENRHPTNPRSGYGGIIVYASPGASVLGNTVYRNSSSYGGGILADRDSTGAVVAGNHVYSNTAQMGGGISFAAPNGLLANNIVHDNSALAGDGIHVGTGGFVAQGPVHLVHNTVARNSGAETLGAIYINQVPAWLTNTILVSSTAGINVEPSTLVTMEATLWGSGAWANTYDILGPPTIVTGTRNYWGDPAFANPAAGDFHLTDTSPALDRGVATSVTTDIDGESRGGSPDLGADEVPPGPISGLAMETSSPTWLGDSTHFTATVATGNGDFTWSFGDGGAATGRTVQHTYSAAGTFPVVLTATNSFGVTTTNGSVVVVMPECRARLGSTNYASLQAAIDASAAPGDLIKVAGYCTGTSLIMNHGLTVRGGYTFTDWTNPNPVANLTTMDGRGQLQAVVYAATSGPVTLESLHITNGLGGVYAQGDGKLITGCQVYSNAGTGIALGLGTGGRIVNNRVYSNTAGSGAGISTGDVTDLHITGNQVYSNTAAWAGAGIMVNDGTHVTLEGNEVHHNRALGGSGGGVFLSGRNITATGNLIYRNTTVDEKGGGVAVWGYDSSFRSQQIHLSGNLITDNTAGGLGEGGGAYIEWADDLVVAGNRIAGNTAGNSGGGVKVFDSARAQILDNVVTGNRSGGSFGGGLFLIDIPGGTISGNTISGNWAQPAGGLTGGGMAVRSQQVTITRNRITGNTALNSALWVSSLGVGASDRLTITGNLIDRNTFGGAGALYLEGDHGVGAGADLVTLDNNVIWENHATQNEAEVALRIDGVDVHATHNTLAYNAVTGGGGESVFLDDGSLWMTDTVAVDYRPIWAGIGTSASLYGTLWSASPYTVTGSGAIVTGLNRYGAFTHQNGDFHLAYGSAAIDAGVCTAVSTDHDGDARPYGAGCDLGADEAIFVTTPVAPASPATLTYVDSQGITTSVQVPAGAVTTTITLAFVDVPTVTYASGFSFAGQAFALDAFLGTTRLANYVFSQPVLVTIGYRDADLAGMDESKITLRYWNAASSTWNDAACGPYDRHPAENWLAVPICHLSQFALFQETVNKVYLPLVQRNH